MGKVSRKAGPRRRKAYVKGWEGAMVYVRHRIEKLHAAGLLCDLGGVMELLEATREPPPPQSPEDSIGDDE